MAYRNLLKSQLDKKKNKKKNNRNSAMNRDIYPMKTEIRDRQNLLQGKWYLFNLIGKFSYIELWLFFSFFSFFDSVSFLLLPSSLQNLVFFFFFLSNEDDLAEVLVEIFDWFLSSYFATDWQNRHFFNFLIFFIYYNLSFLGFLRKIKNKEFKQNIRCECCKNGVCIFLSFIIEAKFILPFFAVYFFFFKLHIWCPSWEKKNQVFLIHNPSVFFFFFFFFFLNNSRLHISVSESQVCLAGYLYLKRILHKHRRLFLEIILLQGFENALWTLVAF